MKELQPWRTFSIFISSTFADMQAERDHLRNIVFPKVEEELQNRRIKLEIVDLRWGIDTTSIEQEEEREANVLKVCLDEIKRCRPFFIGLLGDRYGWVPSEERMKTVMAGEERIMPKRGKSVTELEIEFGVLASTEQLVRSVFYFRNTLPYINFSVKKAAMFSDMHNRELSDHEKNERKVALEKLKFNIRNHFDKQKLDHKVQTYSCTWEADKERVTGLEAWGEIVYEDILSECKSHAEETWDKVPQNWKEQELVLLDAFIEGHIAIFCGRNKLLIEIKEHLLSREKGNWGMVLTGESGSGKSSVFAMVKKMMDKEECFVLAHSAGLSHRAKNVLDLLLIWNTQLSEHIGIKDETEEKVEDFEILKLSPESINNKTAKPEIEKIQERFRELLFTVAQKQQVVLLVDALDRFEPTERARFMTWLPRVMPGNIRMLCTATTLSEKKAVQYHNGLFVSTLDSFTRQEAKEMLDTLCKQQHKTLPQKVSTEILGKVRIDGQLATTSPLWLSLAVNMMMALDHDDFEKMSRLEGRGDQQIENYMANMALDFDPLPGRLFLSLVNKAGQVFGKDFSKAVFNYLASSRNGLREKDLEKLLEEESIKWEPLLFAGLRRWFKAHLVNQGEELQWNLAHKILHNAIILEVGESENKRLHNNLATYLLNLGTDSLKTTETLYHLLQAGKLKAAASYYGSALTVEEEAGAAKVLAETITRDKKGIDIAGILPQFLASQPETFIFLIKRYIYDLDNYLAIESNLNYRLKLLENLKSELDKTHEQTLSDVTLVKNVPLLYHSLGSIHGEMGHMEEAHKYYDEYFKLSKEFYESDPQDELHKDSLASSYKSLGSIKKEMGNTEGALKYFNESFKLSKELYDSNPHEKHYKIGLAISYSDLGDINSEIGHMDKALKCFEKSFGLRKELYESNPHDESNKIGLAISYERLYSIHHPMGHIEEALKYADELFKLSKDLFESNPQNVSLKKGLALSYGKLGNIHRDMGNMEEAHKYSENQVRLFKELYEANPLDESLKHGLAISYDRFGYFYKVIGHMEKALNYYNEYFKLSKELFESNPQKVSLKDNLARSYGLLGSCNQEMGQMEEALKYFGEYFKLSKELFKSNPQDLSLNKGFAISLSMFGALHLQMGHLHEALKYFGDEVKLYKELFESNPKDESLKKNLAIANKRLGSIHQAMGYIDNDINPTDYGNTPLIQQMIEKGEYHDVIHLLKDSPIQSNSVKNTLGVCFLRFGAFEKALNKFLEITRDGTFGWLETAKIENKRNLLVTTLLLKKIDVYQAAIKDMDISEIMDEGVQRIIKTYANWEEDVEHELSKVSFLKRAQLKKELMKRPITFDFPIGELDF